MMLRSFFIRSNLLCFPMSHVVAAASLPQISNACACMLRAPPHANSSSLRRTLSGILQVFAESCVGDAHVAAIVSVFLSCARRRAVTQLRPWLLCKACCLN